MAADAPDIKEDLCNYLQVIDNGNFATSGPVAYAKNPGLFVKGIGKVGLPLSDRDAADLSRASHEAPFGKGSETYVDPAVRKTWELNPNQFELRNPAWTFTLQQVVEKVAKELGVIDGASNIRAELHKLLLYEPGAFFEKHRDTEKAPGMFATLVIALPSEHTGGDVVVQLRDEEQTLKTQGLCDFDYSYLSWYADVNHSVSKIESGHRLVLTYNLIRQAADSSQLASVLDDHKQNLDRVLALWSKQDREIDSHSDHVPEKLVYILEHEYSEANICLDHLRGKDQLRTRYLLEACRDQDFCLYLAHFEYCLSGSIDEDEGGPNWGYGGNSVDYHEFIDEFGRSWRLQTIFQHNGKRIAEDIDLEEEELLENVDFTGIEPDDEECDGYTGNEGCTATHFYRRTCAVILPRGRRFDILSKAENIEAQEYTETLLKEMQDDTLAVASREELQKLCELFISREKMPHKKRSMYEEDSYDFSWLEEESKISHSSSAPDMELASISKAILRLNRPDLIEKLFRVTSRTVSLDLFQELGKGNLEYDISRWRNGIKLAISRIPTISERVKAVDLLTSSYREAAGNATTTLQRLQNFENEIAMSVTETQGGELAVTAADAQPLNKLCEKHGEKFTFEVVVPLVKKNTSNVDFIVAFLKAFRAGETDALRLESVQGLFKGILSDVIPGLNLHRLQSPTFSPAFSSRQERNEQFKRRRLNYYDDSRAQAAGDADPKTLSAEHLANLFFECERLDLSQEIDHLANKIISEAPHANPTTFDDLLLPLLKHLPPLLNQTPKNNNLNTPSYVKIFRTVIPSYITTYVQPAPQKPTGFERQPRGCGGLSCEDCIALDAFLQDAGKATARFAIKAQRRDHLEARLRQSTCSTETVRGGTPYTLVVTKQGMEWENAMKEWKRRCGVAVGKVEEIGVERLRELLGEGWEDDVGLMGIRAGAGEEEEAVEERRPLGELGQGKKGMGAAGENGVSGKVLEYGRAEIIDLSGE